MRPRWIDFGERDRDLFQVTLTFLEGRLQEAATLEWAVELTPKDVARRAAALEAVDRAGRDGLAEPWRSAWSLIEDGWDEPILSRTAEHLAAVRIQERLSQGDRSGTLIEELVALVRPRLSVATARGLENRSGRWKPRRLADLLHASLTSGELVTPAAIGLNAVEDAHFLTELARRLEGALYGGLAAARRFGWDGRRPYGLGLPDRIAFVASQEDGARDVDEFTTGLGPVLKLLHEVLRRLIEDDPAPVASFAARLKHGPTLAEARLWAALALDPRVVGVTEVADAMQRADDRRFWDLHHNPEFSQLRAVRFGEIAPAAQARVIKRILRGPPRTFWPRDAEVDRLAEAQCYWIARELRRLEVAGHALASGEQAWLKPQLAKFRDLAESTRVDEGFPGTYEAYDLPAPGDDGYDLLVGEDRLQRLEAALRTSRGGWGDDPADGAARWIGEPRNAAAILSDFEARPSDGRDYPEVWDRFGSQHRPTEADGEPPAEEIAQRVISLLGGLPDATLSAAVGGLTDWLSSWRTQAAALPDFAPLWRRLWPYAVARTNSEQPVDEVPRLDTIVSGGFDGEPQDLDTYNTAAGKMVGAFLALCPTLAEGVQGFPPGAPQTELRDLLVAEKGRAGLVVKHRLAEHLSYFMRADPAWTGANLLPALAGDDEAGLPLWNAVTRHALSPVVLEYLAPFMLQRAIDSRVSRQARRTLAFRLVVDCLHAFKDDRAASASHGELQRMIRSLDEEVRAHAAEAPQRFLRDVPKPDGPTSEALFDKAVVPFLQQVWPQERSLATPGVSRAFADLPASAPGRFAAAVDAVERFLVPFDCWSLLDYGLYGEETQGARLRLIDTPDKAEALLRLFDRTVGSDPGAIVPHELSSALERIRLVGPHLAQRPEFRRLATSARL